MRRKPSSTKSGGIKTSVRTAGRIAKVFRHGGSQAVRLPKEFRFSAEEVFVRRDGDDIILSPKEESVADVVLEVMGSSPDFMKKQSAMPAQQRPRW